MFTLSRIANLKRIHGGSTYRSTSRSYNLMRIHNNKGQNRARVHTGYKRR